MNPKTKFGRKISLDELINEFRDQLSPEEYERLKNYSKNKKQNDTRGNK